MEMVYALAEKLENYLKESEEELIALIRDLCAIPAPSHREQKLVGRDSSSSVKAAWFSFSMALSRSM